MKKYLLLLFCLFLAGCANSDFPFCCNQTGVSDVPYLTTYHFESSIGMVDIGEGGSFLTIVSQGDVTNLFNAANVSQVSQTGVITGGVLSLGGGTVGNVVLEVTNANGKKIGDLFYNSLGGIPDFSITSGTSLSGRFTILNTPPGEVYLKAVQGGRGNGSGISFAGAVSNLNIFVVPVIPSLIGVTGPAVDFDTKTKVPGAFLTPLGLPGQAVIAETGLYRFPSLSTDSYFLIQAAAPGYLPTISTIQTDLSSIPQGAIDVTQAIFLYSQAFLLNQLSQTGYNAVDPAKSILVGGAVDPDGTLRVYPYILLADDQGNLLNFNPINGKSRIYYPGTYTDPSTRKQVPTFFYYDSTGTQASYKDSQGAVQTIICTSVNDNCPPKSQGALTGQFVAFDLPPGQIHISATALEAADTGLNYFTGGGAMDLFPGAVSPHDVNMSRLTLGVSDYYQAFSGRVTTPDGTTPVGFASLFALGNSSSLTTSDITGIFNIPAFSQAYLNQGSYTIKVSHSENIDTYQRVTTDGNFKNLVLFPTSLVSQYMSASGISIDNAKGILTGMIIDNSTRRGTEGITLQALDLSGKKVGAIRYFDSSGLPTQRYLSSKNGRYIIFNLPPGFIQIQVVSPDDSGNLLTHVYPGGIMMEDLHVNNAPPLSIQVSGQTKNLDGSPMSQVNFSLLGESTRFVSGADATFSQSLAPFSHYVVKARSPLSDGIDTYNLFDTLSTDIKDQTLWALTGGILQTAANLANLTLDRSLGVLGGKVTTIALSSGLPDSSYLSSPMTDVTPHKMVIGLFNHDNEVDVAVVNSQDNTLSILLGGGDGTFLLENSSFLCLPSGMVLLPGQSCLTSAFPTAVRSADLNGDGITDLIVANQGADSITVLLGTANGNFVPSGPPISLPPGSRPIDISVGDFNQDNNIDLVVLNSGNNTFSFIPGNGNGTFSSQIWTFSSGGVSPIEIQRNDFNRDGIPDLAILHNGSRTLNLFLGLGNGIFMPSAGSPLFTGTAPLSFSADDLNGDGLIDFVVANSGSQSLTVILAKLTGLYAPPVTISLSSSPRYLLLSDLNLDGRSDIIASLNSGNIAVLTGIGDGTFTPEVLYPVGVGPVTVEAADFNDDFLSDLLVYQMGSGTLSFLPGKEVPLPAVSLAVSDFDGNQAGQVEYLDQNGNVIPGAVQTDSSGMFLVLNVPPGYKNVHLIQGATGNKWMTSYPGSAVFSNLLAIPPKQFKVNYSGKTVNAVGDQVSRYVGGVNLSFLGTGLSTTSNPADSTFSLPVDANSAMLIKVQR